MLGRNKYYSLRKILDKKAQYNIIIGERSNGKTFSALVYAIEQYVNTGKQTAILRRWHEDFSGLRGATMFDALTASGKIVELTKGNYTDVYYWASRWFLCRYNEKGEREKDDTPFCYGFSLSAMEHDKSSSYPNVTTIIFDEFISRNRYLPNEFTLFTNTISTIIRQRNDVTIFMLGNTVNKYGCPYFDEMGLKHIKRMKQGDIDLYTYGESKLRVAVEYCASKKESKASNHYFAFDNPHLQMIIGGEWEVDIYPHRPIKYTPRDILFKYFIEYDNELLRCEIVSKDNNNFTFIYPRTTKLTEKEEHCELIYSPRYNVLPNWKRNIYKPRTVIEKKILEYYIRDKIFYATNEVGEIMRNYLMWCRKE